METSYKVWATQPTEGFVLSKIIDLGAHGVMTVLPYDSKYPKMMLHEDQLFPYNELDTKKDVEDNCNLMNLNAASLLNNIKLRYYKNKIYTYVANILIAVNPYHEIPDLYSSKTIKSYQGKSLGSLAPHVFAISDKVFRDMKVLKQSQSIVVSGESGAGKTESTKYLLRYLCDLWGGSAGPVEQKILDANPVMEAFGNAKTTRNNNSSRFGKFMEVHFGNNFQVAGGYISHYLLEKSRICTQGADERNYHVFYLLCAGAPEQLRNQLCITKPDDFHYLKHSCTQYFTTAQSEKKLNNIQISAQHQKKGSLRDSMLDDVIQFDTLDKALSRIGLDEKDRQDIYSMVAAVLHLGNIAFEDNPEDTKGGSRVTASSERPLSFASKLMGVDSGELRQALVSRVMQSNRGGVKGTVIMVPLKVYEATSARDALAKAIYSRLFDYIVQRINKSIPYQKSSYYIGVLDIAGFEYFTVNSFEQFCINYCNEKLQQFFNERVLKDEQELYYREGLQVPKIEFSDNQDCIDLIEAKGLGIFSLLDEESKLPKQSAQHFTLEVHRQLGGHFRLAVPRTSRLKAHRELRDDEGFVIRHYAGGVCYQTSQFPDKNNDALHASLECLIQESKLKFLQDLFQTSNISHKGKLTFDSVGSKFKSQLAELMEKLRSTGTSFIRCIKPNHKMVDHQFEGGAVLSQLECSGMTNVLNLMQFGYPSRVKFHDLHNMYHKYLPSKLSKLDPRTFCQVLLLSMNLKENDYRFGTSRIFFRPGKFKEFDEIMRNDPENLKHMVVRIQKRLIISHWQKAQWCTVAAIKLRKKIEYRAKHRLIIQKNVRMYLAQRKHKPRINALRNINTVKKNLDVMQDIISEMKRDKKVHAESVKKLQGELENTIQTIKSNPKLSSNELNELNLKLRTRVDGQMNDLKNKLKEQKNAEEQEKLRKMQEQIELERKRKEAEEIKKKEEEEIRKKKAEMEARRKQEEEERKRQEEEDRKMVAILQAQMEKEAVEEAKIREQIEQERRDHELALRLAEETNGQLEEVSPPANRSRSTEKLKTSSAIRNNRSEMMKTPANQNKPKFDLSKWKYSELRDTINTSCDIELLEACRIEFHRRLKVYHAWKAKNRKRTTMDENERAPRSIMEAAGRTPPRAQVKKPISVDSQRYFRIPFIRPSGGPENNDKKGWWYAHFDGQYVARQMELHPDKASILLVAGVDDMQMCELSLDETGLTRKRGAEILETEFNREWERHGGKQYFRPAERSK